MRMGSSKGSNGDLEAEQWSLLSIFAYEDTSHLSVGEMMTPKSVHILAHFCGIHR